MGKGEREIEREKEREGERKGENGIYKKDRHIDHILNRTFCFLGDVSYVPIFFTKNRFIYHLGGISELSPLVLPCPTGL